MASATRVMRWRLNQPMYNFRSRDRGNLTVDYSDGADHRWPKWLTSGPKRNAVTLSTPNAAANTNAFALVPQASDTSIYWLYTAHGDQLAKNLWSDFTAATNQPAAVSERVTGLLATRTPAGTRELSAFMLATAYAVYPTITATGSTDTVSANNETQIIRIAGIAPDRIIGFSGQKAYGNVLSDTVTMDASAWQELGVYRSSDIVPTGFAMDQDAIVWGTNIGPILFHDRFKQFFLMLGELPADMDNCRAMRFVEFNGVMVPLSTMLRKQNGGVGRRVGPERFGNPNPIQGKVTAIASNVDWMFTAHRNEATDSTYLAASKPGLDGLPDYYGIGNMGDVACEVADVPAKATRSRETLLLGAGSNLQYITIGNVPTWPDDTSYTFQEDTNQTIYGTEWYPDSPVTPRKFVFELPFAAAGQTVAPGIRGMTESGQSFDQTFIAMNKTERVEFTIPPHIFDGPVTRYQPYFVFRTSSTSATAKMTPEVEVLEEYD